MISCFSKKILLYIQILFYTTSCSRFGGSPAIWDFEKLNITIENNDFLKYDSGSFKDKCIKLDSAQNQYLLDHCMLLGHSEIGIYCKINKYPNLFAFRSIWADTVFLTLFEYFEQADSVKLLLNCSKQYSGEDFYVKHGSQFIEGYIFKEFVEQNSEQKDSIYLYNEHAFVNITNGDLPRNASFKWQLPILKYVTNNSKNLNCDLRTEYSNYRNDLLFLTKTYKKQLAITCDSIIVNFLNQLKTRPDYFTVYKKVDKKESIVLVHIDTISHKPFELLTLSEVGQRQKLWTHRSAKIYGNYIIIRNEQNDLNHKSSFNNEIYYISNTGLVNISKGGYSTELDTAQNAFRIVGEDAGIFTFRDSAFEVTLKTNKIGDIKYDSLSERIYETDDGPCYLNGTWAPHDKVLNVLDGIVSQQYIFHKQYYGKHYISICYKDFDTQILLLGIKDCSVNSLIEIEHHLGWSACSGYRVFEHINNKDTLMFHISNHWSHRDLSHYYAGDSKGILKILPDNSVIQISVSDTTSLEEYKDDFTEENSSN